MADIKSIAEALVRLSTKEVNELAMVMKDEYDMEPAAHPYSMRPNVDVRVDSEIYRESSPKQYGISLLNRKRKKTISNMEKVQFKEQKGK